MITFKMLLLVHKPANSYVLPSDEIPVSTVLFHLNSLDVAKSTGSDGLSAQFLKAISNEIAEPLLRLSLLFHQISVHKSGAENDKTNYRPIAVISIIAKLLEKIVATQLSDYFESNEILHPHQGAYRHGKSTEDILLVAVDTIVHCLDEGNIVCTAFLDL